MFECFYCGHKTVMWESDCTFDEVGAEGEGIVFFYQCSHCGAWIEYYVPQSAMGIDESEKRFPTVGQEIMLK